MSRNAKHGRCTLCRRRLPVFEADGRIRLMSLCADCIWTLVQAAGLYNDARRLL